MMFSQNTYILDDDIQIFFTDSGPVPNSNDYTTLIIFHGSAFTGHCFEKLHNHAKSFNFRTVIWNRRDYPGSTLYAVDELEDLEAGRQVFLDRLGKQVAQFSCKFIEKENIPKMAEDGRKGGIALMGWSMGTATAMPLLSDKKLISTDLYNILEPYLKSLVLYDAPFRSFGFSIPPDADIYNPWADPECSTPEELYQNFISWVSSYYDHPSLSAPIHELDFRKRTDIRTASEWTPEEFARFYCESSAVRSEFPMYAPPMQETLSHLRDKVLFDESLSQTYFPKLTVAYLVSEKSPWETIFGCNEMKKHIKEHQEQGTKMRTIGFYALRACNHFAHYDNVLTLMETISQSLKSSPYYH